MIIRSLNLDVDKYGYPLECGYSKATFNGHTIGMAICIKNMQTGEVEQNFLKEKMGDKETRDALLEEMLKPDSGLALQREEITQFDENTNELVLKEIYYLPYYVKDHVMHQPTIMSDNIVPAIDTYYDVEVELLLSEEGNTRYLVPRFQTRNKSVMDLVYDFFEFDFYDSEQLKNLGINYQHASEDQEEGYVLDFYDEFGHRHDLVFSTVERIRDSIVSVRLVKFERLEVKVHDGNEPC